ncbi:MAG: DNA cytosine methyltransferase [Akkermansiaceae bacterium]|nr:DNA cytosine methyltransferase [Akkermansiaceae bacterium]
MKNYPQWLDEQLRLRKPAANAPMVLDLFAGCGGLALGFEAAAFHTLGYEMLPDACETYNRNLHGECRCEFLDENTDYGIKPEVIIGGPPCQPFSVGGLQMGHKDTRDGFPAYLSAVKRLRPRLAIFENVRGMFYRGLPYLEQITACLEEMGYLVECQILKAVDYGVLQRRERLFVVAHRGHWKFPEATISSPVTAGGAVGDLIKIMPPNPKFLTASMDTYVAKYEKASKCIRPRDLHLDQPARTVTCRNLNGATGDMMRIDLKDGRRRRITVREGARLQSFPDWFEFAGAEGSQYNQVGNAVPPILAKAVANAVISYLAQPDLTAAQLRSHRAARQKSFSFLDEIDAA